VVTDEESSVNSSNMEDGSSHNGDSSEDEPSVVEEEEEQEVEGEGKVGFVIQVSTFFQVVFVSFGTFAIKSVLVFCMF